MKSEMKTTLYLMREEDQDAMATDAVIKETTKPSKPSKIRKREGVQRSKRKKIKAMKSFVTTDSHLC